MSGGCCPRAPYRVPHFVPTPKRRCFGSALTPGELREAHMLAFWIESLLEEVCTVSGADAADGTTNKARWRTNLRAYSGCMLMNDVRRRARAALPAREQAVALQPMAVSSKGVLEVLLPLVVGAQRTSVGKQGRLADKFMRSQAQDLMERLGIGVVTATQQRMYCAVAGVQPACIFVPLAPL